MTEHRFLVFSLNIAILSAAQHETLSFLREHVFLWNADNILHLSVLFLLNFSGQIPLIQTKPTQTIPNQTKLTNHSSTCAWALNYSIRVVFLCIHNMFWGQSVSQTNQLMLTSENQKYGLIWLFLQAFWRTRGPNREFSTLRGCLGVCGKLLLLRIA